MTQIKLRKLIGKIISKLLIKLGIVSSILKKCKKGELIISIYFHNPSEKIVSGLIRWFLNKEFYFLSADELVDIIINKKLFPPNSLFLSIDDGWKENINNIFNNKISQEIPMTLFTTIKPILNNGGFWWSYIDQGIKKGIDLKNKNVLKKIPNQEREEEVKKAMSFISIENESINESELLKISAQRNITIGSHTYSHPILTKCDEKTLDFEIGRSKLMIENILKNEVKFFAYPNGCYSSREINKVKKFKYKAAFTTQPNYIDTNTISDPFQIPRFEISDDASFEENICRATGIWYKLKLSKRDNA